MGLIKNKEEDYINRAELKNDNNRYMGIDIGLNNLAAIASNTEMVPVLIKGKSLKSMNKFYNDNLSYYKKEAEKVNNFGQKKINNLTIKRDNKITDYMHKASSYIINLAISNDICTIIIGNVNATLKKQKEKEDVSFVEIPYQKLIEMIGYKAKKAGINVIICEETYTSGTSFLDEEMPNKENYNKERRKYRGLFVSNDGKKINADINGSLQIIKKVFPHAFDNGIEHIELNPIVVNFT